MRYRYVVADVFTDKPFTGNPLAVFPEAQGLSAEQMQRIAAELNLSETTFVLPPETGGYARVRIFTPASELPFAGHPTLAWLTPPVLPRVDGEPPAPEEIAPAISLDLPDLDLAPPGPAVLSAGNAFLVVPLRDAGALARARVDTVPWRSLMDGVAASGLYMFCSVGPAGSRRLRARLFAPDQGIPEDPATGSAAAALPADLTRRHDHADGLSRWTIEQGIEMGRPSEMTVEITVRRGAIEAVRVGGAAVIVSEGTMDVPGP